jgi:hypothetical protein
MELWAWKTAAISILVSLSHFGSFGFSAYLLFVGWEKLDFIGFYSFFSYFAGAWIGVCLLGFGAYLLCLLVGESLISLGFCSFSHILELGFSSICACSGSLTSLGFCSFHHILWSFNLQHACLLREILTSLGFLLCFLTFC